MDEKRGIFIVIEGVDGSGKATQLARVRERLEAAGHSVETFDFPRYEQPSSYFVKRYLEGAYGGADEVGPYTSSLFYALDRFEAAPKIREALQAGKVVVSNRYTGSNMAHQGTKIANAEQRRGFFIWLDNLEFEMLRIPRPDISFVLRVPTEISIKLMEEREKDIHEADESHLQRTLAVYDDMTQLFPKDFQRIDCVRSGQLLDVEAINSMLWEKVAPLLPKPAGPAQTKTAKQNAAVVEPKAAAPESAPPKVRHLTIDNASGLLVQKVERLVAAVVSRPEIPSIYTPANLIPDALKEYQAKGNAILGLYAKLVAGLAKHGINAAEARQNAGMVLPVAATSQVKIDIHSPKLEDLIINLINDNLPEAQAAGANLFAQAIQIDAGRFKNTDHAIKKSAPSAVRSLAEEFLADNHIGDQPAVQLTGVWPRNEGELVADMLYEYSSLPLHTVRDRVSTWPMNRKLAVYEAYLSDSQPGAALEKAHYSWDLQGTYTTFREFQRLPSEGLAIQSLTPRYGFEVPQLIEDADLADTFEKCFDLSVELYSILQRAGHQVEAQYATLYGHKQRWQMTQNAVQIIALQQENSVQPGTQRLIELIGQKLAEVHPVLAEVSIPSAT